MKIIRAEHMGMCFGVRDAIALAFQTAQEQPLTVLGDLVHNENVIQALTEQGVRIVQQPDAVETEAVMITAHGASDKRIREVVSRGKQVLEATCPLVHVAHRALRKLVSEGYHPVVIGKRGHVEVRGLTEDLQAVDIVLTEAEIFELQVRERFGVVAQTTQPVDRVRHLAGLLQWRFPKAEVKFVDTVCQPTKQRQAAANELARQSDVVVVIGGAHSNNTHELVKTCGRHCNRVFHVQTAADLRREWFDNAETVGITAGTSTPDYVINGVEKWLCALANEREPRSEQVPVFAQETSSANTH